MQEALDPEDMLTDFSDAADGLHRTTSNVSNMSGYPGELSLQLAQLQPLQKSVCACVRMC